MSKQAEGGKARAAKLTKQERSAIAKKGAEARWGEPTVLPSPKETHQGIINIGDVQIQCSVLEDKTRVLSQRAIVKAFGSLSRGGPRKGDEGVNTNPVIGGARLPRIFEAKGLKSHIPEELMVALSNPIAYRPKHGGRLAYGYEATMLPRICTVILEARDAKDLSPSQAALAAQADMLIRALAQVAIIALVDEATGYQADRDRDELQKLLSVYLSSERLKWVSRFPNEFFEHVFRLRGWHKPLDPNKRPRAMGIIINKIVYDQLPEGVIDELQKRNPVDFDTKRRKWKHHQFLSEDIGQPDLRGHILQLLALMRISDSWDDFYRHFLRAFHADNGVQQELDFDEDDGK